MTANAMPGDREQALGSGMDDHITKPVVAGELEAVLARWIGAGANAPEDVLGGGSRLASPPEYSEPSLDLNVLEDLRRLGGSELLSELSDTYARDGSTRLAQLARDLDAGDAALVARTAHALRGSSSSIGAARMAELCAQIEDAGASNNLEPVPDLLRRLESEFERVRMDLTRKVSEETGSR